jgi:outer membrane lipopolysaccharide assembly protein LptE/RlpB
LIRSKNLTRLLLLGAVFVLGSCGYSTSPALLPSHLKTIAIPVFENETSEYTLEQEVTNAVVQRFVADNHLKVVEERVAQSVIKGRIKSYRNSVFGISAGTTNRAEEYRVAIVVSVTFKDVVKNRELWSEDNLEKTANYYVTNVPGQTAKTELDGRKEAITKIADEILSRSVQGW